MKNGKSVYYYRTYDENGRRTSGRSTGETTKTGAHAYISRLIERGELIPKQQRIFQDYACNWWTEKCPYTKKRAMSGKELSPSYIELSRHLLTRWILPHFGKMPLTKITASEIENWIVKLKDEESISDAMIKNAYSVLRLMFNELERTEMIYRNPFKRVVPVSVRSREKGILTIQEYRELFDEENISSIWNDNLIHFTVSLLSASGGLRLGEVLGLQNKAVFQDYVVVMYSYSKKHGLRPTKSKYIRYVPLPAKTSKYLHLMKGSEPNGYVFSVDGGRSPLSHRTVQTFFTRVLERVGIDYRGRNITFHSYRHAFTTYMRKRLIPDQKLRQVVGHRSIEMLNRYDHPHFEIEEYRDILDAQSEIWG